VVISIRHEYRITCRYFCHAIKTATFASFFDGELTFEGREKIRNGLKSLWILQREIYISVSYYIRGWMASPPQLFSLPLKGGIFNLVPPSARNAERPSARETGSKDLFFPHLSMTKTCTLKISFPRFSLSNL